MPRPIPGETAVPLISPSAAGGFPLPSSRVKRRSSGSRFTAPSSVVDGVRAAGLFDAVRFATPAGALDRALFVRRARRAVGRAADRHVPPRSDRDPQRNLPHGPDRALRDHGEPSLLQRRRHVDRDLRAAARLPQHSSLPRRAGSARERRLPAWSHRGAGPGGGPARRCRDRLQIGGGGLPARGGRRGDSRVGARALQVAARGARAGGHRHRLLSRLGSVVALLPR